MMQSSEYSQLVRQIFELIQAEINYLQTNPSPPAVETVLKLPIMFEFFRYLRGEAFHQTRPVTPDKQSGFYQMEKTLREQIGVLYSQLDFQDPKTQYHLEQSKQLFEKSSD